MNKKTSAQKQNNTVKSNNEAPRAKKTLRAANSALPVGMGTDKSAYIVKLLDTVSQQLRRSETERELLWRELEETRRLLVDLEERAGRSEKSHNFMREEVEKNQQETATLVEQLSVAESRAESAVDLLEDISEENVKITHKIERLSQDKTRLNRKLNLVEEAVTATRETLEAKALVLLTDKSVAAQSALPRIEGNDIFADRDESLATPAKIPQNIAEAEERKIKSYLSGGASISVLLMIGVAAVWSFSHFGQSIERSVNSTPAISVPQYQTDVEYNANSLSALTPATGLEATPTANDYRSAIDNTVAESGGDINSVAEMLNALEPSSTQTPNGAVGADVPAIMEEMASPETIAPEAVMAKASPVQDVQPALDATIVAPVAEMPNVPAKVKAQLSRAELTPSLMKEEKQAAEQLFGRVPEGALASRISPDKSLSGLGKELESAAFSGNPEAQHDLAALYTAGQDGIAQNFERAVMWFSESAYENVANARYNLGVLHHQGIGTLKNLEKAIQLYRAAAFLGHPEAQYNLGIAYAEGIGVPYSIDAAIYYFENSAVNGITESAYNLGLVYENGLLGKSDNNRALFWYNLASESDNIDAQKALGALTTKLGLSLQEVKDVVRAERRDMKSLFPEKKAVQKVAAKPAMAPVKNNTVIDAREIAPEADYFDLIAPIQEQLMALGLYPGPADGINGPMTEDAIRSYQTMFGLTPDGQASAALVEHMLNNVASASGR